MVTAINMLMLCRYFSGQSARAAHVNAGTDEEQNSRAAGQAAERGEQQERRDQKPDLRRESTCNVK